MRSHAPNAMISLDNFHDCEQVYQRCVLVRGRIDQNTNDRIHVSTSDEAGVISFPDQEWPVSQGKFRALLMLSPGTNVISFNTVTSTVHTIKLTYIPLLQTPPLHLAIMIPKDSHLLVDCSSCEHAVPSSTTSTLDATIQVLRMTAYMCQAHMADDLNEQGLGRRAFRLEEEWSADTVSRDYLPSESKASTMQCTAKVHLVRIDKTMAELHGMSMRLGQPPFAQKLVPHEIFADALRKHGGVFTATAKPLVAALGLYGLTTNFPQPLEPSQGTRDPNGFAMGVISSGLAHAWPRFVEDITNCLSDTAPSHLMIGHKENIYRSMWEDCAHSQAKFLCQIERAIVPSPTKLAAHTNHTSWVQRFSSSLAHAGSGGCETVDSASVASKLDSRMDPRVALKLRASEALWLPGDRPTKTVSGPRIEVSRNGFHASIAIIADAGIAKIWINGREHEQFYGSPAMHSSPSRFMLSLRELEAQYDRSEPLEIEALDMNGVSETFNVRSYFCAGNEIRIPGTDIKLLKNSVKVRDIDGHHFQKWQWTVMLKKRGDGGAMVRATQVDIRVGAILDGAEVYYKDGSKVPCGPQWDESGHESYMGGHQAKKLALHRSTEIVKVAVNTGAGDSNQLHGLRMWRSDGKALGALNVQDRAHAEVAYLEPDEGHHIVGFYGRSATWGHCIEFGIITAAKDVELPDAAYDLPELQNTDGGPEAWPKRRINPKRKIDDVDSSDSEFISEDEDVGYDYDQGDETVDEDE